MEAEITKATKKGKTVGKKRILQLLLAIALIGGSAYLLKGDVWTFWTWWLLAGVLGLCAMPLTGRLFQGFADKGWIFSKALAIAVTGFFTWFLVSIKLAAFTTLTCVAVVLIFVVCCIGLFLHQSRKGIWCMPEGHGDLVFWEEVIFFAAFLMWTYFAGFHPQAYGTEKFMDYGFMEAMMRSTTLPATDLWYSQGKINYYYGGQYFAVFLTKLSVTKVAKTYNLMRTFVAAFAFAMPFSLVYQMVRDRMDGQLTGKKRCVPPMAGLTAGVSLSLAGNGHYIVYRWVLPWIQKLQGVESDSSYWFPDATRYIGYNPYREEDRTIHEFPSYSFVLGDLHAHVVNILFVLLLIGILYAWMKKMKSQRLDQVDLCTSAFWKREMLSPYLLLAGLLLGMYQWTNFWDFVIYFVVTGGVMLFGNIGFMGMPMIVSVFPGNGALYASVFMMIDQFMLWTLGVKHLASGGKEKFQLRKLVNPATVAIVLAVFMVLTGLRLPALLDTAFQKIGATSSPLAMIYVGGIFATADISKYLKKISLYGIVFLKMILMPVLLFVILGMFPVSGEMRLIMALLTGMPTMTAVVMMANASGLDGDYALGGVLVTTMCGIFTLPAVCWILQNMI